MMLFGNSKKECANVLVTCELGGFHCGGVTAYLLSVPSRVVREVRVVMAWFSKV